MAKSDDAPKLPSEKKSRKIIQPPSGTPEQSGSDVSDDEVKEINESLKALDPSLESDSIKPVEDDGKPMPELVPVDSKDNDDEDILSGADSAISDEEIDSMETDDSEDQEDSDSKPEEEPKESDSNKEPTDSEDENESNQDETDNQEDEPEPDSELEEEPKKPVKKPKKSNKKSSSDEQDDDPVLDKAVKEIVAEESDAVLAAEDDKRKPKLSERAKKRGGLIGKIAEFTTSKSGKRIIFASIIVFILLIALIPHTRYFALNTVGVRSKMEVRVIDSGTLQPLKNVSVRAGGADGVTNEDGVAALSGVKLGRTTLKIEKRAFAPIERGVTIGWGSNPLGEYSVEAVGTQYTFLVKDFLSNQPIARAQASSGDGNATSDEEGKFVLTLDTAELDDAAELNILITAENYREETLNITVNNRETQEVKMAPSRKHVFVSKRSGKFDVYSVYADGKLEEKLVGGSGLERDDIGLVPHQNSNYAAFISTRENARNASGYLLSTLYIIETESGDITKIDQSEKIQIIGWSSSGRLVYVKIAAGASGTDPKRHRIMSFDSTDFSGFKELASSNTFNDVVMADDKIYYAPSNIFQENPDPGAFVINPNGEKKSKFLDKEAFMIVRTSYNDMRINSGKQWYAYNINDGGQASSSESPSSQVSRVYLDSPDGKSAVWVDERDGKGALIIYNKESGDEKTLLSRSGLRLPVYWLNDSYLVFRVFDGTESADYVLNMAGGEAVKVTDATNTTGISRWFYY